MTNNAVFVRRADVPAAEFGDELAVMDLRSGSYLTFNRTAASVWKLLETPRSFDAICAALLTQYDVEPADCEAEVRTLLAELGEQGIIESRAG